MGLRYQHRSRCRQTSGALDLSVETPVALIGKSPFTISPDVVIPLNGVLRASVCISSMKLGFPEFLLAAAWSAAVPPSWSVACSPLCWPSREAADDDVVSFAPWQPK